MNRFLKMTALPCMLIAVLTVLLLRTWAPAKAAPTHPAVSCGSWSAVSSPNNASVSNALNGVAAISNTDVLAVGSSGTSPTQPLIEQWNGTQWSIVTGPSVTAGAFNAATRVLGTNKVWAVGSIGTTTLKTLIEQWNGTAWTIITSPNAGTGNNALNGVAGVSAIKINDVWAVGYSTSTGGTQQTLIEHWNGTKWSLVTSPNAGTGNNVLYGVSAFSTTDAWAVGASGSTGSRQTLIEHWDGTSWTIVTSPNHGADDGLNGVSTISTTNAYAVGYSTPTSNPVQTLIEHWDGTSWSTVSSPKVGTFNNTLKGVSAVSATNVWAVGNATNSNFTQTLIVHWNGTKWSVVSSPNVGLSDNELRGAARIPGTTQVWAVGTYSNSGSPSQTLTEFNC